MKPSERNELIALVVVVVIAAALRMRGLDFGLPMAEARPDEMTIAFQAMKFGTGDLNPHSFNYPSLFKYLVFVLFGAWYVVGKALGLFDGQEDFLRSFFAADTSFRLLMRAWSAAAGVACVALLGAAPGRVWGAALLAVCFLHVRDSHFGVTDATLSTLTTAAWFTALILVRTGTVSAAAWAGVFAGLAASVKYNGGLALAPVLVAALVCGKPFVARAGAATAASAIAFVAGSPFVLLDFPTFWKDFSFEMSHLAEGHHVDVGNALVHHLTRSLPDGMGWPLLLAGVLGLVAAVVREWRVGLVLATFPVVWLLAMGRGETAFYRYVLPVVPALCAAAGLAVASARPVWARVPLLVLVGAPTAWASLEVTRLMAAGDTRAAMGAWIEANVPSDARIVHAGAYTGAPMLQRNVVNQTREYAAKASRSDAAGFRKPDDLKWYRRDRPMYDVVLVDKAGIDFASTVAPEDVVAAPPAWLMLEDYPLAHYAAVPAAVAELAAARYDLAHEEIATVAPPDAARFDQQDAFYAPVAGFVAFGRMGPTLRIYRLRSP